MTLYNTHETKGEKDEIEKALRSLSPRQVPPGLRTRILAASREARKNLAMTPQMWMTVSACAALIVAALLADAIVSKYQSNALPALVSNPAILHPAEENLRLLLAEISAEAPALGARLLGRSLLIRNILGTQGEGRKPLIESIEAVERLKGWI